jgi:hypothetical protein
MKNNDIVPGFDDETDESLQIPLQRVYAAPDCLLRTLTGCIQTPQSGYALLNRIRKVVEAGFIRLIFDVAGTKHANPIGIDCYTGVLKAVLPHGGYLVLIKMSPERYEFYSQVGFSESYAIKDTVEEAISIFRESGKMGNAPFPRTFICPNCNMKQNVIKPGVIHCAGCKTGFKIDPGGNPFYLNRMN